MQFHPWVQFSNILKTLNGVLDDTKNLWESCNISLFCLVFIRGKKRNGGPGHKGHIWRCNDRLLEWDGKFYLGEENEAGQRLTEFWQENTLVTANTLFQQHKKQLHMNITRWSILKSDWLYSLQPKMQRLYTVSKNKAGSWLWIRSWTPYCRIQT